MRFLPVLAALSAALISSGASAYTLKSLHSFCALADCRDGSQPLGGLVADASGDLYGITGRGGKYANGFVQGGTVFELSPNGDGTWTHTVLHNFCVKASCADGNLPFFGMIVDAEGALYGTTQSGGAHNAGVAFKLTPGAGHTSWMYHILYNFCSLADCADGDEPSGVLAYQGAASGVAYDGTSPLYATTAGGGTHGEGAVFRLAPNARGRWSASVLYSFCAASRCTDGDSPRTGVVVDGTGALYGVTYFGGTKDEGTLFKLTNAGGDAWSETVLSSFCTEAPHCADGERPSAVPVIGGAATLYGSTPSGGTNGKAGTLYSYASGSRSVLYDFCPGTTCTDGAQPSVPMILDGSGNLFGTTELGGSDVGPKGGKAFEWNGSYQVIYDFCTVKPHCADGNEPFSPLLLDSSGNLFGETLAGGTGDVADGGGGTVYELMP